MNDRQGRAQRVLNQLNNDRQSWPIGNESRLHVMSEIAGAKHMHRELSNEARAVLAEWKAEAGFEYRIIRDFCKRLGLDLDEGAGS